MKYICYKISELSLFFLLRLKIKDFYRVFKDKGIIKGKRHGN